jgi:hypothetical protein
VARVPYRVLFLAYLSARGVGRDPDQSGLSISCACVDPLSALDEALTARIGQSPRPWRCSAMYSHVLLCTGYRNCCCERCGRIMPARGRHPDSVFLAAHHTHTHALPLSYSSCYYYFPSQNSCRPPSPTRVLYPSDRVLLVVSRVSRDCRLRCTFRRDSKSCCTTSIFIPRSHGLSLFFATSHLGRQFL